MSETEVQDLFTRLKQEVMAAVGRWVIGIIASWTILTGAALTKWNVQDVRIERLETWKTERMQPIEDYYENQRINGERFAKIEARLDEIMRLLKQQ